MKMRDTYESRNYSEGHTCNVVDEEECWSPCTGLVGYFAIQRWKGDMYLQKPVNRIAKSNFRTGSRKRQFKSPREGDNDEDNHETIAMIRQQLYGPGGPYENMMVNWIECESHYSKTLLANLKQRQDDHEDEEETAFSQQPAKKKHLGSSDFEDLEISGRSGDMAKLKPVNGRSKSNFRTGSRKRQFKSPREGDNDEDNHDTIAMIRQQLYGPGGPYENMMVNRRESESRCSKTLLANRKQCQDDHEDEEETASRQQPAKKNKLGLSDFGDLEISGRSGDMAKLKTVNGRPKSSFRKGSRKRQCKSPREGDTDEDNHETLAMIRQQLYGPGGPYENMMINHTDNESLCSKMLLANPKRCRDDNKDEEETAFSQQPAKQNKHFSSDFEHLAISGRSGDMANLEPVNGQPMSSFRKGSRKVQFKLPCEGDNDDEHHKNLVKIRQQQYYPSCHDENQMVNQTDSESHCSKTLLANPKRCQDDHEDEEEAAFSQQSAKKTRLGSSDFYDLAISGSCGDVDNLKLVNRQPTFSSGTGLRKVQVKLSCEGDNGDDDYKTFELIYLRLHSPGGPDENLMVNQSDNEPHCSKTLPANRKRCRDDHEDGEETAFSQQPAKKPKLLSSDFEDLEISGRSGDMAKLKPVNGRSKSNFRTGSRKRQFKSPREGDNDEDNHDTIAMIRQQLYGPGGPYENMMVNRRESESRCSKTLLANRKQCQDDHEDEEETASRQQPAKKNKLGLSDFGDLEISGRSGDMAKLKTVNGRPKSSFRKGSRKRQCKSPREGDTDEDNHETLAMIRQQLYGPGGPYENMMINHTDNESLCSKMLLANPKRCRDDNKDEEETAFSQQPAKQNKHFSSDFEHLAISGRSGDMANLEPVNGQPMSSFRKGSRKVQFKLPCEGDNDDEHHKNLVKIRQQQYYPSCHDENQMVNQTDSESHCSKTLLANPKRCQDDHEDEEEAAFSQQSAKKTRLGSSDFYDLAISGSCGDVDNLKLVNRQPTFSSGTGLRKVQVKLSCEGDNGDDDYKTFELIYLRLHSPGGPDENLMVNQSDNEPHCSKTLPANRKRCRDDHEDGEETAFSQQPAKKPKLLSSEFDELEISGHSGDMAKLKPVNRRPTFSCRKGSRKQKCKSPREGDHDEDNHETLAMIRQQLYSRGGPYENMIVNQTGSESRCSEALLANRKRSRDNRKDEEETAFSQQSAKKNKLGLSDFGDLEISGRSGDMANLEPVSGRPRSSFRKRLHKRQCKSPREGDNDEDNRETLVMIRQQLYGPGGPYENMMVNQFDPSDLASSSFHQQATTSRTRSLPSLSSVASDVNQTSTDSLTTDSLTTANQGPVTKTCERSYSQLQQQNLGLTPTQKKNL